MWRRIFRRAVPDQDIGEELDSHLAVEVARLMEDGLSRDEAESQARRAFGNIGLIQEATREAWGWAWLERLCQDVQYGLRSLRRSPGFTIAAVLSLALGIGASTAIFSLVDTVFLRPLPYLDSNRLVWVAIRFPSMKAEFVPSPDFVAWRRDNQVFEQLSAVQADGSGTVILSDPVAMEVHASRVSFNFLSTFGVSPSLGRSFRPEEELPGGPKAVLLTSRFWRDHFHSDRSVIGRSVRLDGRQHTIVGVLPASFVFPMDIKVDLLTTLPVSPAASHHDRSMSVWAVFGELKPGVTLDRAKANLESLFAASKADAPRMFRSDTKLMIDPLQHHRIGDAHVLLFVLSGAVAFLLLIACANVANLLLARWSARSRELAVRAAIGAGRNRLVRQLFTETALLTIAGCALGLIIVVLSLTAFVHYGSDEVPRVGEVTVDARVLLIAAITSCITTVLFGWLPALRAGSVDIQSLLQSTRRLGLSAGHARIRRVLVATEIAVALVLLSGASLLLETVWHLENDRLGFQPERVLTMTLELRGSKVEAANRVNLADDILRFLQQLPGTEAVALTQCTPLSGGPIDITFSRFDRPLPEAFHRGDGITVCGAGPSYLTAARVPLVRGRFFADNDFRHPRTLAVINEAAARAYFPGEDPLYRRIVKEGPEGEWKTVIGVVSDTKNHGLRSPAYPEVFVNDLGLTNSSELLFIVRTAGNEKSLEPEVREKLRTLDPGLFAKFETLNESMAEMSSGARFNGVLVASFAWLAFIIAIIGVYGLFAYAVTERTQEIGIRMAVGARPAAILGLVLSEGAWLVTIGSLVGLSGALAVTRYMNSLLYDVSASNPRIYAAAVCAIALAALFATWVPAWRASSIDPVIALRHE